MKKIIITGGAGFIGTNLSLALRRKKIEVVVIDNLSSASSLKNKEILKKSAIPIVRHDLSEPLNKLKIFEKTDAIVHLAANCSTSRSIQNPRDDFLNNALTTLNILEYSRLNGKIPIIYASTCKVYSTEMNNLPISNSKNRYVLRPDSYIDESFPIEGRGLYSHAPYGCSKYTGDLYCQEYALTFGLPIIINRLSTVFGNLQHGSEESGWIYHFIEAKKKNKAVTIFGTGKQVRDCLWIDDLIKLFLLEVKNIKKLRHKIYNAGGGFENSLSLLELVDYLNKKPGKKLVPNFEKVRPADLKSYITNINKVKQELGWEPTTNVFEAIDLLYKSI